MNLLLHEIYKTKLIEDPQGNLVNPFPTATPSNTGTILKDLIQQNNLNKTLEIGMAYGLSTLFICQAHHDKGSGSHIAIDPFQSTMWKSIGLHNIKKAGLSAKLQFFEAFSYEVLPQLLADGRKIDFAFIDGSHQFDYTLLDFFYIDKLLEVGGYAVFDDIWMPGIRKVLYFILKNRAYEIVKVNVNFRFQERVARIAKRLIQNPLERDFKGVKWLPGNICVLKKLSEDNRYWDFYRSF